MIPRFLVRPLLPALLPALLLALLLGLAAGAPARAQELRLAAPGTAVEFDNGGVYRAFAIVGDQVFVREDTGNDKTIVHVLRYGRFDTLIFRDTRRSEIYFTQGSVEDMLAAAPNVPLDIAYEVYEDNRLTSRVNGVARRGEPAEIEVGGRRMATRPLSQDLFFYDPDGTFQRNVKYSYFYSEDFGLPLRIEFEDATSGERFVITATGVTLP
ncbi:MAG: hypothetical protein WD100_13675 [Tistlia sp.]|uniref:hypothetical protein n=1 Tax=Tistlia sp. TaxID=3057121 RepID=UPI0034A2836D